MYTIGIDLGTTNVSCHLGWEKDGVYQTQILPIKQLVLNEGNIELGEKHFLPSVVFFNQNDIFTGNYILEDLSRLTYPYEQPHIG